MKRYETLGINLNTIEGLEKIISLGCKDIGDGYSTGFDGCCKYPAETLCCEKCMAERLFEEVKVKKVKRWEIIKSDEDVIKLYKQFKDFCNPHNFCTGCPYSADNTDGCFSRFLCEEIETFEEGDTE